MFGALSGSVVVAKCLLFRAGCRWHEARMIPPDDDGEPKFDIMERVFHVLLYWPEGGCVRDCSVRRKHRIAGTEGIIEIITRANFR